MAFGRPAPDLLRCDAKACLRGRSKAAYLERLAAARLGSPHRSAGPATFGFSARTDFDHPRRHDGAAGVAGGCPPGAVPAAHRTRRVDDLGVRLRPGAL